MSPMLAHQRESDVPTGEGSRAAASRTLDDAPLITRVSRRELALNQQVWVVTWATYFVIAVSCFVIPLLFSDYDRNRLWPFAGLLLAIAAVEWRVGSPAIDTIKNHAVLAAVYIATALGMVAFHPTGSISTAAAMFIGPLVAVRLVDRRQIGMHYGAAAFCIGVPLALGLCNSATMLTAALVVPATLVLGGSRVIVLEAAEKQGDELEELVRRDPLTG